MSYLDQLQTRGCQETDWSDLDVLCQYWLSHQDPTVVLRPETKLNFKPKLKVQSDSLQCQAQTRNGQRCSRKCQVSNAMYCGSHVKFLPCGRYDDPLPESDITTGKRSKGKRSQPLGLTNVQLDQIDLTQYLRTRLVMINGKEFLMDDHNVIYTNDNLNTIIGIQKGKDYEWFLGSLENWPIKD